ncbi:uncharacterized protein LOC132205760 [Neocloeon triangulifer]|uniref:uncharacterized protein LOC132205760 n=1 Tax=Neocloeon triangulifer TaxID=2078957 RepID=UPI00286EBBDF|nr:uncharacterized protein LOC132205760 [Neocloeon triangulifer]
MEEPDFLFSSFLVVLIIILIYLLQRRPWKYPPGPRKWPIVGTLPSLKKKPGDSPFDLTERLRKKYGDVVGIFIGPQPSIFINGYKCVKEISNMEEFGYRPNILTPRHEMFKEKKIGVIFSEGSRWKNQRRFTLRHLRDFGFGKKTMDQFIQEEINVLLSAIRELIEKHPEQTKTGVDVLSILPAVAINTLWYIIAGVKHDLHDERFTRLTQNVLRFFRLGDRNSPVDFFKFLQHVPVINRVYKEQKKFANEINNYVLEAIKEHRRTFDENHTRDFIDIYLKEMQNDETGFFDDEQLATICVDLFLAGTETSSSTIGFTLRYLIKHQEVQDKVRSEILAVVGKNRPPTMADMPNLPYCTAVLTESLRHSGVTPFPPPRAPKEDTWFNGYLIPKRAMVMINLRSVLMDPVYWGDPENFRPERFIGPDGKFKKDERLVLFGTGMRMCLGEPFARNTTFLFYTSLVQNFKMEIPPHGPELSERTLPGFTTAPAPFKIKLTCPRNWPLLGTLPAMVGKPDDTPFDQTDRLSKKYGNIVGLFLGVKPAVLVSGYDCVKEICAKDEFTYRPNMTVAHHKMFNHERSGIFFAEGEKWKSQRRFTLRHLRDFGFGKQTMDHYIHEEVNILLATFRDMISKHPEQRETGHDFLKIMPAIAINTLWYIIAGERNELTDKRFMRLTNMVQEFFRHGDQASPVPLYKLLQHIPVVNSSFKLQEDYGDQINHFIKEALDEHLKTYNENNMRDFMDVYIRELKKDDKTGYFSEHQLIALCNDLFLAGTETTASTTAFTLRYLIKNPDIQDKVRKEIHEVVGKDRLPSTEDIPNLPYCAAVLAETFRHSGLTPATPPRTSNKDATFRGYKIPKGTMILINLRSVNMDKVHFEDPEIFRPERFIGPDGKFQKDDRTMPFGSGTRLCLGEPFARNTAFIFYTSIVQNFKVENPPYGPKPSDITLKGFTTAPEPFKMTLTPLN